MAAYHEEKITHARVFELAACQDSGSERRIADQDAIFIESLDDDKMPVAMVRNQADSRHTALRQRVQRSSDTVGLVAAGVQKALHVEKRKPFRTYLRLIAGGEHCRENRRFVGRAAILESQQRGHGGRAATEVVLLVESSFEGAQL